MQRIALAIALLALWMAVPARSDAQTTPPPNFVVILTDDQPIGTLDGMPNVLAIRADGTAFTSAIISNPLCCPSRTTLLTGLYSHDDGVYTNGDTPQATGGYDAFIANDNQDRTFALALHDAGYQTGLFGKYLNHYDGSAQVGWDALHSFVGPNGRYYDYDWTIDGAVPEALSWLQARDPSAPFLLYYAPFGPHGPVTPAPQDEGQTSATTFPTAAFNEADVSDKPTYIQALSSFTDAQTASFTDLWNEEYATLLSIDRWVGSFRSALEADGQLQNTYFIFLSDNGLSWGDHRWSGKMVPYERSIRVPLLIDGPGVLHKSTNKLVANIDLAPTILDLAGLTSAPTDGISLRPILTGSGLITRPGILLEHENFGTVVPTFCGIRQPRWMFARYAYDDGHQEEELYNLRTDPNELVNVSARRPARATRLRTAMYAAGV